MSILVKFSKIFDFGPNLQKRIVLKKIRKMSILFKFWKNFDFGQNLRKKSILVMFWKKGSILVKISEKCGFFWIFF